MSNTHMYKGSIANVSFHHDAGGYFYAFSKKISTQTYTEVFANIVLPTQLKQTAAIPRNAYISLGMGSPGQQGVDLGLVNTGNGWHPYYQDFEPQKDENGNPTSELYGARYSAFTAPSNATNAGIVIKPVNKHLVHMYIQFQDASGNNVGKTFDQDLIVQERSQFWDNYYRFASLIPSYGNVSNNSDETYMIGGKFTNIGIYNGSRYEPWGINTSLCTLAWAEEFPKAQLLNITANGEEFRIDHWA